MEAESNVLKVTEFITVGEIATMMNVSSTEIISTCHFRYNGNYESEA